MLVAFDCYFGDEAGKQADDDDGDAELQTKVP
jgi:hypothetical protein